MNRAEVIESACRLLAGGKVDNAKTLLITRYPAPQASTPRAYWTPERLVRVFIRDSFTDRYSGQPLVFPGTLRALSILLPETFPYHPNWRQSETHPAFWELYPTIDHVVPVARGGSDDEANVVTTSMLRNGAKGNWLLEELNWPAPSPASAAGWDGLLRWFLDAYSTEPQLRASSRVRQWHTAALRATAT
jgi:hypothetical protein